MSSDPSQPPGPGSQGPGGEPLSAEQQEMLRQMEEEMRKVRVQDLITQSVVSILNLSARRIAKDDERDLEQGRLGIEAVRALVDLLDEKAQHEVRNALSQVQMLYAQQSGGSDTGEQAGGQEPGGPGREAGGAEAGGEAGAGEDGPRKPPPGLWVPGS
jgi:hypothetical protein